jgi:hypothetical protein
VLPNRPVYMPRLDPNGQIVRDARGNPQTYLTVAK